MTGQLSPESGRIVVMYELASILSIGSVVRINHPHVGRRLDGVVEELEDGRVTVNFRMWRETWDVADLHYDTGSGVWLPKQAGKMSGVA